MQSSGHQYEAAEKKQGTTEYFDAGQNDLVGVFLELEAVDAAHPEALPFPDNFPPLVTLGYAQRNFDGQVIRPQLKGKTGPSRHLLTVQKAAILADGIPLPPISQGGEDLPDPAQRCTYGNLFFNDHDLVLDLTLSCLLLVGSPRPLRDVGRCPPDRTQYRSNVTDSEQGIYPELTDKFLNLDQFQDTDNCFSISGRGRSQNSPRRQNKCRCKANLFCDNCPECSVFFQPRQI